MNDAVFQSSLSEKEIDNNFKDVDLFSGIMAGLEEALAYEKSGAKAATRARKRSLPKINVAKTRKDLKMSQKAFASVLGVSPRTVEAWEAGRTSPSPTAINLMYLIGQDPSLAEKLKNRKGEKSLA